MQSSSSIIKAGVAAHFGASFMLVAGASHASVVFSGPVALTVPATTAGLYLNVVTGVSNTNPGSAPGWDINPFGSSALSFFNPAAPTGGVYVKGSGANVANLALGTLIGSASLYTSGAADTTQWMLNSTDNYLGFRLRDEGATSCITAGPSFRSGRPSRRGRSSAMRTNPPQAPASWQATGAAPGPRRCPNPPASAWWAWAWQPCW